MERKTETLFDDAQAPEMNLRNNRTEHRLVVVAVAMAVAVAAAARAG